MSHEIPDSKKRDRDDFESATLSSIRAIVSCFQNIQLQIDSFMKRYLPVVDMISRILPNAEVQPSQFQLRFFGEVAPSYAKVWARCLMLLSSQALLIDQMYDLNEATIQLYTQLAGSPSFEQEQETLISCYQILGKHITFVGEETRLLVNRFQEADPIAKATLQEQLHASAQLIQWVHPFLNRQPDVDPLFEVVAIIANAKKVEKIQTIKDELNTNVMDKLTGLIESIDSQLKKVVDFDSQRANISLLSYSEKVAYFANYCVNVLHDICDTSQTVSLMMRDVDKSLMELRNLNAATDDEVNKFQETFIKLESWMITLSIEKNCITPFIKALSQEYAHHADNLSPELKAFMKPWLDEDHPAQLEGSIFAYQHQQNLSQRPRELKPSSDMTLGQKLRLV